MHAVQIIQLRLEFLLFNGNVMCLGNQQFVTLLLYLDDICVFGASIDEMLDEIE